jgi:hypothetical protein
MNQLFLSPNFKNYQVDITTYYDVRMLEVSTIPGRWFILCLFAFKRQDY